MVKSTYAAARDAFQISLATYNATNFSAMGSDEEEALSNAHFAVADALLQAPADSLADVLEKFAMLEERYVSYSEAVPDVDWAAIKKDIVSLAERQSPTASRSQQVDASVVAAWQRFSDSAWETRGDRPSTEQSRADENLLSIGISDDPTAVAKKLRYALYLNATSPWLEAAALGAVVPDMAERLMTDDTINEAIWSAIVSLEAMEARP